MKSISTILQKLTFDDLDNWAGGTILNRGKNYVQRVDHLCRIGQVKPKAYEEATIYLRLMRKVYTQNQRLADWQALLDRLRKEHKAKRRLMGVLDTLSKKKIVG